MSVRDYVVEGIAAGFGALLAKFLDDRPSVAEKAEVGKRLAKDALALIPDEELYAFLSDEDERTAEVIFRAAKAAKLAGK